MSVSTIVSIGFVGFFNSCSTSSHVPAMAITTQPVSNTSLSCGSNSIALASIKLQVSRPVKMDVANHMRKTLLAAAGLYE